jgi:3-methyladenine DNA glycosylase AlkD
VVTFTRKVGESGEFTDEALALCDKLIWDPEDLVQKGVGWALKDSMRSAHDRVVAYVKDLRRMGVPSTITLYAIRDLKGEEREGVLAVKKG